MKLSSDSPELTAYALGELTAAERSEVEAALAASPELRAELAALWNTAGFLTREFAAEPAVELAAPQREAIVGKATDESRDRVEKTRPVRIQPGASVWLARFLAWRQSLIWATAAAAALAVTLSLWPRSREADVRFNELRYQVKVMPAASPPMGNTVLSSPEPNSVVPAAPENKAVALGVLQERAQDAKQNPPPPISAGTSGLNPTAGPSTGKEVALGLPPAGAGAQPDSSRLKTMATLMDRAGVIPTTPKPANVPALAGNETKTRFGESKVEETLSRGMVQNRGRDAVRSPAAARRYGLAPADTLSAGRNLAMAPEARQEVQSFYRAPGDAGRVEALSELSDRALGRRESVSLLTAGQPVPGTEGYSDITDNPFKEVVAFPLSTFGLDVDTASYANVRRFLHEGSLPPRDAVRLEELINYFHYDYPAPRGDDPFNAAIEIADCPWKEAHKLVRIGLQSKTLDRGERPRANLVFLLDVSGSMEPENKLPLVKRSLRFLLEKLGERDSVGIVTYAGEARVALEPTGVTPDGKQRILTVLEGLRAGSGTHGSAGILNAYAMATNHFIRGGVNRVLLCTDGDFNIGVTDPGELHRLIEDQAKSGVFLSVLGYGMGNYKDGTMELLADKGNGNYAYIDSFAEARKVLGEQLEGTLVTVAKDVKVQVEFNPARVARYRLLGYENRLLRDRDFNDDTKDAGEVGAGHQITVLYEVEPAVPNLAGVDPLRYRSAAEAEEVRPRLKAEHGDELLNLKLRYKAPDGDQSRLMELPVKDANREFSQAGADFKFAAAVAGYGMLLRNSPYKGDLNWEEVLRLGEQGLGTDKEGYRAEFIDLARKAAQLSGRR